MMPVKNFQYVLLLLLYRTSESSSSCVFNVSKGGENYFFDLSRLPTYVEQIKNESNSNTELIMHLSLCNSLQMSSSVCTPGSLVCIVKKNLTGFHSHVSIPGSFYERKMIGDDLYFKLESDLQCHHRKNYSTEIRFRCSVEENSVKYLGYYDTNCRYKLVWTSPYACPISNPQALDVCLLKDKNSIIDFRKLRHPKHYKIEMDGLLYEINICGLVIGGHCNGTATGCRFNKKDPSNSTKVIGSYTDSRVEKDGKNYKIIYPVETIKEDGANQMEIKISCDYNSYFIRPSLPVRNKKDKKNDRFVFSIGTPLACTSNPDCWIVLNGDKYDISRVHPRNENVRIRGPLNTTFLLSACGPLVRDSLWPGGGAHVAHVFNNGTILNIGQYPEFTIQKYNKTIFAVFRGGDRCGENDLRLTTKIKFSCSEKESEPVFLEEVNCVYIFEWKHSSVCPVKFAEGTGCEVKDPIYGRDINLNLGPKELSYEIDSRKSDSKYNFKIFLCSGFEGKCNGDNDTSVCLRKGNEEINIGKKSSQMFRYESGGLFFTMTGDVCKKGVLSTVHVEVICDYFAPNNSKLEFSSEDENCNFYFKWLTRKACPPENVTECSVTDKDGALLDLTPLILHDQNYNLTQGNSTFLLNVCRSLWYGKNQMCPLGAGACLVENNEFHNLGEVKNPPRFNDEGQLTIVYDNGRVCRNNTEGMIHEKTIITFICDSKNSGPECVDCDKCLHSFIWKTPSACGKKDYKREDHQPCTTYHPVTKFQFDLNQLKGLTYSALGEDNSKYRISVCESLRELDHCPNRSGVCGESDKRISYGSANDRLFFEDGHLRLNYTDGDPCDGERKHYTVIEFGCCLKDCPSGPDSVAANDKCEHFVRWRTKHACDMVDCVANGSSPPRSYDLSVLRRSKTNYKINMTGTPVFINVCKMLSPERGLNCPLTSSSCIVNGTKTYSFGYSHTKPVFEKDVVLLKYDHGSICELDQSLKASSAYFFKCNRTVGVGIPVYEAVTDDCEYDFVWETSVVCPDIALNFDKSSCNLVNKETNKILDLRPAFKRGAIQVKSGTKDYLVNLCLMAPTDKCNSALCSVQKSSYVSYGEVQYTNFSYNYNTTTFVLTEGARCDISTSQFYNTEIRLICTDNMEDVENGWTAEEIGCKIIIEWRSLAACYTNKNAASTKDTHILRAILMGVLSGVLILLLCAVVFWRFAGNRISKWELPSVSCGRGRSQSDCSSDVVYTRENGVRLKLL